MQSELDLKKLKQNIESAQIKDRYWLNQQLTKLEDLAKDNKPFDKIFSKFESRLAKSIELSMNRNNSVPTVQYPDGLPVAERRDEIVEAIRNNQVVVIAGETGSGKTTQLPKMCLEAGRGVFGKIGHTQPRRLAARAVATRIAEEIGTELGDKVGFQVRFSDSTHEQTLIKLMTDGILLSELQHDRYLNQYDTIIIDEAHERSLNIDFILGILKNILQKRPDLKVIITSATIDVDRFSKHFSNAPVIEVSGRTFPVEVRYRSLLNEKNSEEDDREDDLDMYQGILEAVNELALEDKKRGEHGDVLVFLSGEREIREAAEVLRKAQLRSTEILPLYARLTPGEQQKIFSPSGARRIVLATNVAETSLTVPGIKYVIDTGLARISRYSYRAKVQRLPIEPISQASANQRKGRCGRVSEGICIRLYDEQDFLSRPEFTDPEIRRTNLAAVILQMTHLRLGNIEEFPFIDPPDSRFVKDGVNLLQELGGLNQKGHLTAIGQQLAKLPVDPRIARMIIEANKQNSLAEVMVIAAALSVQDPRDRPQDKQAQADQKHAEFRNAESDYLTLLNIWNEYEENRQELSQNQLRKYCKKHFLSFMRLREWRDVHRQLHIVAKELKFTENQEPAGYDQVHKALLSGLLSQIGQKTDEGDYLGARNKRFHIFPGSGQNKKKPKWIMVGELVETSRLFGRNVSKIEPEWVEPLAKNLLKRSYQEPHWAKKRGQVVAFEQVTLYGIVIVPKRRVSYQKIDPDVSREIFIQSALVEQQLFTKGKFLEKNKATIAEVEELESKARKRDILVDDRTLFEFYQSRVPKDICDQRAFEAWRKEAEGKDPTVLLMTKEILMRQDADHVSENLYPDYLAVKGYEFATQYRFEPGHPLDGVTIQVPAAMVSQLPEAPFEWLVPGMLRDKCVALIKGLPKAIRKQLVPVPDYVTGFLSSASDRQQGLCQALEQYIYQSKRLKVEASDWQIEQLEPHLLMNFEVLDEEGEILTHSRSMLGIKNQFKDYRVSGDHVAANSDFEREGITKWDFGQLPEKWEVESSGMKLNLFPALVEQTVSKKAGAEPTILSLKLLDHPQLARLETRKGLVRLAQNRLAETCSFARKEIPKWLGKNSLAYGTIGSKDELVESLIFRSVSECIPELADVRDEQLFVTEVDAARSELVSQCQKLTIAVGEQLKTFNTIQQTLKSKMSLPNALAFTDIKQQLGRLFYPSYISEVSGDRLKQYDRYLQAIQQRIDRLQGNQQKDKLAMQVVQGFHEKIDQLVDGLPVPIEALDEVMEFRWLLEELRISLFAQPMKTLQPVSEKRLNKQWEELLESVRNAF